MMPRSRRAHGLDLRVDVALDGPSIRACERLEPREVMSTSPFSSLIFQAPPAKNPPLVREPFPASFPRMYPGGSRASTSSA